MRPKYNRVLLKLSGESIGGAGGADGNLNFTAIAAVAHAIKETLALGIRLAVVIGAGNILRGASISDHIARVDADKMGMLGTVINAMALQSGLRKAGVPSEVLSFVRMPQICRSYTHNKALECLENGHVAVFAGGTGHPFFTTDTAASLCAAQIKADLMVKATKVAGVYSDDPLADTQARFHKNITYDKVLQEQLAVMDAVSIVLCRDNGIPIRVCDMTESAVLRRVVCGEELGTLITHYLHTGKNREK